MQIIAVRLHRQIRFWHAGQDWKQYMLDYEQTAVIGIFTRDKTEGQVWIDKWGNSRVNWTMIKEDQDMMCKVRPSAIVSQRLCYRGRGAKRTSDFEQTSVVALQAGGTTKVGTHHGCRCPEKLDLQTVWLLHMLWST